MGEAQIPALISKTLEAQRTAGLKADERAKVAEEAPRITESVASLIRLVVPDPKLDTDNFYFSTGVDIDFTYKVGDESVKLRFTSPSYPHEGQTPSQFWIHLDEENSNDAIVIGSSKMIRQGATDPFDQQELSEFEELLGGIRQGLIDGNISRWIRKPEPYARNGKLLDTMADEARALSQ
jgi:hypothetical protein